MLRAALLMCLVVVAMSVEMNLNDALREATDNQRADAEVEVPRPVVPGEERVKRQFGEGFSGSDAQTEDSYVGDGFGGGGYPGGFGGGLSGSEYQESAGNYAGSGSRFGR